MLNRPLSCYIFLLPSLLSLSNWPKRTAKNSMHTHTPLRACPRFRVMNHSSWAKVRALWRDWLVRRTYCITVWLTGRGEVSLAKCTSIHWYQELDYKEYIIYRWEIESFKCMCARERWWHACTHTHKGNVRQYCASCVLQTERRLGKIWAHVSPGYTHARARTQTHTPLRVGKWAVRVSRSRWWHCRHGVEGKVNSGSKQAIFHVLVTVYMWKRGSETPHTLSGRRITAGSCKAQPVLAPRSLQIHRQCCCLTSIICVWGLLCFQVSQCQFNICYHEAARWKYWLHNVCVCGLVLVSASLLLFVPTVS